MWLRVPSSSSSPHRPQFDSVLKYPSTSSCVGIGRPAVIPASTPPVTRFEAPRVGYPAESVWTSIWDVAGPGRSSLVDIGLALARTQPATADQRLQPPSAQRTRG